MFENELYIKDFCEIKAVEETRTDNNDISILRNKVNLFSSETEFD